MSIDTKNALGSEVETDDIRIVQTRPLIAPAVLMADVSADAETRTLVRDTRLIAQSIFAGSDDRVLVVVGPCSIHDPAAALEYAGKLKSAVDQHRENLLIVMRVYFEKPRTTVGWKGLINDPHMDGSFDINEGLHKARHLLVDLARLGIPAGTEFLDTISPQFVADLIAWGAIGARTTESQVHRELASGLSMPVGFKNGTGGSVQIAVDGIKAALCPHHFLSVTKQGVSAIVETKGNDACHVILRGSSAGSNYDEPAIREAAELLEKNGLHRQLMVDCSHGNSRKDHRQQPAVAEAVGRQIAGGSRDIASIMLESNLVEGSQSIPDNLEELRYGQSVTDACMDWDATSKVLDGLAAAVEERRSH